MIKYRRLKLRMLAQTIVMGAATATLGYFILQFFVDGVWQAPFADAFVTVCENIGMNEPSAIALYNTIFRENKPILVGCGFILLLIIAFYVSLSTYTFYLEQLEIGIENILTESDELVELDPVLLPLELKLNSIKTNLKEQQLQNHRTEQRKNDLVVYLAHDLKTPLTSVIAYLSILAEDPELPLEQRAKYANISLEKAIRLGELIDEFFEITRYNLSSIVLEKGEISLNMMMEQIIDEFYALFEQNGMECDLHIEDDIYLSGDPDRLARVFDNIIRNAICYSYEKTPIHITARRNTPQTVEIRVRNHGKQIAAHKLEHIFEKFYRLDDSRSSKTGGAGLGLAIAKEIVELHQGSIEAVSTEQYTEFIVVLPCLKASEETETGTLGEDTRPQIKEEAEVNKKKRWRSREKLAKKSKKLSQAFSMSKDKESEKKE
ncbi:MAG: HAMP domain-containing sensor histidine kinase [Lachnospiraceae bacterium]|nr:HAMP domain-containing sensor histidine kinase [Lachnospiraceae bacterium]